MTPYSPDMPTPWRTVVVAACVLLAACTSTPTSATDPVATATPASRDAAAQVREPAPEATLRPVAMWSRGDLLPEVADLAARLDGVVAATHVRSDTLGLVGSTDVDGNVIDDWPDGWRVPVDVGAVDPEGVDALLLDDDVAEMVTALQPGEVLLSETGQRLRRIGVGGRIDLERRADLLVAGVVPDGTVGRAEIVVHVDDADEVGLETDGTLLLVHEADAPRTLLDEIEDLAPPDQPARVVVPDEGSRAGRAPLVLPLHEVKDRFGEFAYRPLPGSREVEIGASWQNEHLAAAQVPILGTVYCHRGIVEDLRAALQGVVDAGLASTIDPDDYAGCYVGRRIGTDTSRLSSHAWGISVDINVDLSLPGLGPPPPPEVIEIFAQAGFRWGGDFLVPDNHHFEWVGDAALERPDRSRA